MKKKYAFINGLLFNSETNKMETQNMVIINGIVVGLGYVPDDDDAEVVDIKGSFIYYECPDLHAFLKQQFSGDVDGFLASVLSYFDGQTPKKPSLNQKAVFGVVRNRAPLQVQSVFPKEPGT